MLNSGSGVSYSKKVADIASIVSLSTAVFFAGCTKFNDMPAGLSEENFGREVNGISVVVAGIVAQKVHPESKVDLLVKKPGWSNAKITGSTTASSIDVAADLSMTTSHFTARGSPGSLTGTVDKSSFDWSITQKSPTTYEVGRLGFKPDHTVVIEVKDGQIVGSVRRLLDYSWGVKGTYSGSSVKIEVSTGLFDPNFSIDGTVTAAR